MIETQQKITKKEEKIKEGKVEKVLKGLDEEVERIENGGDYNEGLTIPDLEKDINSESNEIKIKDNLKRSTVYTERSNKNILDFINLIKNEKLIIPYFQRSFTWDIYRASLLIESFYKGDDVPEFNLAKHYINKPVNDNNKTSIKYIVLDGQQRSMTLFFFYYDQFPINQTKVRAVMSILIKEKGYIYPGIFEDTKTVCKKIRINNPFNSFNLEVEDKELKGISYSNKTNNHLHSYYTDTYFKTGNVPLSISISKKGGNIEYKVLERLYFIYNNGQNLKSSEINFAKSIGCIREFINKINSLPSFRILYGKSTHDANFDDYNMIVKFIGYFKYFQYYGGISKSFLELVFDKIKSIEYKEADNIFKIFEYVFNLLVEKLSIRTFDSNKNNNLLVNPFLNKKTGRFDIALMDGIFIVLVRNYEKILKEPFSISKESILMTLNTIDIEFHDKNIKKRTIGKNQILRRINISERYLFASPQKQKTKNKK